MPNGHRLRIVPLFLMLAWSAFAQTATLSGIVSVSQPWNQTIFTSAGVNQEYVAVSVTFGNTSAAAAAQITVRLTSNENSSVVVEATQQPYMIAICPRQFVQGTYTLMITTSSTFDLPFEINALQESAEIPLDTLVPFIATTPRFFVFNVLGGSEPNLRIQVARLQTENETNAEAVQAPKEVLVGINRCPVPSCPGKGENSRNTNCGYDAKVEPSVRGEGVLRSLATPDGSYYVFLEPRDSRPSSLSVLVTSASSLLAPGIAMLALAVGAFFV